MADCIFINTNKRDKKMKKTVLILILALLLTFVFVACGDASDGIKVECSVTDTLSLYEAQLEDCDFTKFFSITENGVSVDVLPEYLDLSLLPVKGSGQVTINYKGKSATMTVIILDPEVVVGASVEEITLDTKQIVEYDFASLFTITVGGESVEILPEYVDKSKVPVLPSEGSVTLNYSGKSVTVKVILVEAEKIISVTAEPETVQIVDEEFATHKFTDHFSISDDGRYVTVMKSYLTISEVVDGKATVVCTYKGVSATLNIDVQKTVYELSLVSDEIEVNKDIALTYDYLSLFTATRNGEPIELSSENVTTDLNDELGEYTYTVTVGKVESGKVSKTLKINVVFRHSVLIVKSYSSLELPVNELNDYDYTELFSVYLDGKAYRFSESDIDSSAISSAEVGEDCIIVISLTIDEDTFSDEFAIRVVDSAETTITAKNVNLELYATPIDVTELFTIKSGDREIKVTLDMIESTVNYDVAGVYTATCTYGDKQATATITISDGVIIDYRYGNKITVMKGTDQNAYSFANDFLLSINGVSFANIDACVDASAVDFSTVGEYTATLTVKYNTKATGLSSVKFDIFTAEITYIVVDKTYTLTYNKDSVVLPEGTTEYNVLSNIKLTINGRKQTLTTNPEAVSVIACYVKAVGDPIDFTSPARQKVTIELYVYGIDSDPVIATYYVSVKSDINITTSNRVLYVGDTVYTKDLFAITENGESVEVTNEMISGKVDTFVSGVYTITLEYKGYIADTTVVVYPHNIKGEYFTMQKTIPTESSYDDEDQLIEEGSDSKPIGDLVITDESISWQGMVAEDIRFVDEKTMIVKFSKMTYTLHFENGAIFMDPDNTTKMLFSDSRRPLVFFNKSVWTKDGYIQINSSSTHVLQTTNTGYSIDVFGVKNIEDQSVLNYALYVRLVSKTSADTIYNVKFGLSTFADGFSPAEGVTSILTFDGEDYNFQMQTNTVAKVFTEESNILFGKTFRGEYEGGAGVLDVSAVGTYTLYVDGVQLSSFSGYDVRNEMKYGGYDPVTQIVTLFSYRDISDVKPFMSIKLRVDLENSTFTYIEKTSILGYYVFENKMIFLDGFGNGLINYDTKSYYYYKISYTVNSGILTIKYLDTDITFPYGESATFSIESYENVLRIKDFYDNSLVGSTFENQYVTKGAIIRVGSLTVGKGLASEVRAQLEKQITIITKDGVLSDTEKSARFDFKTVKFTIAGFYRFGVKIDVDGEEKITYLTVQILDEVYKDSALVGEYKTSLLTNGYSLTLDKWGRAFLTTPSASYETSYRIVGDNYYARFSGVGYTFNVRGQYVSNGLITFFSSGSFIVNDYLTTGKVSISATDGACLRRIVIGEQASYYYSTSSVILGQQVEAEIISGTGEAGSIFALSTVDNTEYVKIIAWNNTTNGLQTADNYRGSYQNGASVLVLDGFGNLTLDTSKGEYQINANKTITATIDGNVFFYTIDRTANTFGVSSMVVDNSILENKNLSAKYTFGSSAYTTITTFYFMADGKVRITSVSEECVDDLGSYAPIFITSGTLANYQVNKNTLTITVNGETFVFKIKDVSVANAIETTSTTLGSTAVGYFKVGTTFDAIEK